MAGVDAEDKKPWSSIITQSNSSVKLRRRQLEPRKDATRSSERGGYKREKYKDRGEGAEGDGRDGREVL